MINGLRPIDLGLGSTVFPPTALVREAVAQHLEQDVPAAYPRRGGLAGLRRLLAERHPHRAVPPAPTSVVLTCGATQALVALLRVLCVPGDRVAVPDPGFPHYRLICDLLRLELVPYPQPGVGEPFPLAALQERLDATTPRAVIWNSPANPTGWVAGPADTLATAGLLGGRPLHVIADEVYEELVLDGSHHSIRDHLPPAQVSSVHSFSKSLSLAGWRLGYLVAEPALAHRAERAVWAMSMGAPTVAQAAAAAGVLEATTVLPARRVELRHRRDLLLAGLAPLGLPEPPRPAGGCFLWLAAGTEDAATRLAERLWSAYRIRVALGRDFGRRATGQVRLSFGADTGDLAEAVRRIGGGAGTDPAVVAAGLLERIPE